MSVNVIAKRFGLILPLLAGTLFAQPAGNVLQLQPFKVTGTRSYVGDDQTVNPVDRFSAADVENSGAFDLGEFFAQLPPSPNGQEVLVLIDGRPTRLKPSELPPDMIESVEVSRYGAMPQYGAYANGNVINIHLKKDYNSSKAGLNFRGTFDGGGDQEGFNVAGGATKGKLRLIYTISGSRSDPLRASDRPFSANQDHTALGGQDLRLLWGTPAVVQSVSGPLNGVTDANGNPVSVALAPNNGPGPTPADFLPGVPLGTTGVITAAGQRRFDTAGYLYLASPSESWNVNLNLNYALTPRVNVTLSGSFGHTASDGSAAPPVTPVSTATLVPAAFNPFGQDVEVGLVHVGFGPVLSHAHNTNSGLGLNFNGPLSGTWQWDADLGYTWNESQQDVLDLDPAKFSAALAATDPAQRFNPFGDPQANDALYPSLSVLRENDNHSANTSAQLTAHGEVAQAPGGPATLLFRGKFDTTESERDYRHALDLPDAEIHDSAGSYGLFSSLQIPLVGKANARPGLYRLTTELSASVNGGTDRGITYDERLGLVWSPAKSLALHANLHLGLVAPTHYVASEQPLITATLVDPRRNPATAEDVQIVSHDFNGAHSARTDQEIIGLTFEPPAVTSLEISLTYDRQHSGNISGTPFNAQDLVDNESSLPDRVSRANPSAADLALGQPGAIESVDITPVDGGELERSGANLSAVYKLPSTRFGLLRVSTSVRRELTSRLEFESGLPFTSVSNSQFTPPDWSAQGQISWSARGWNASTIFRYTEQITSGTIAIPSTTDMDIQLGYKFATTVVGQWGRGLRVAIGLGGLLAGPPPFADTIEGFRGGSALGRTYSCRLSLPL